MPGAGWIGFDPTFGLFAGEGHIPLPVSAAPIEGRTDPCEVEFQFSNRVAWLRETPRVTKPFSAAQWRGIDSLAATSTSACGRKMCA